MNNLLINFNERIEGAVSEEKQNRCTNAVELYYKAMVHLIDYLLLTKHDIIINNLKHRLDEVDKLDKEISALYREAHILYRGTYKSIKNMQDCKKIKNDIKTIAVLSGLKETLQESIKKIS